MLISTWTVLIQEFVTIFTAPGSVIFTRLMTGWVLCTARRTVTGMLPFAEPRGRRAHDAYHRFFPDSRWEMARLWQTLARLLVSLLCPQGTLILALDDTLFHHSGRKMDGAGFWRDAVRSSRKRIVYAWGLNLVVLTLQVRPPWGGMTLALPINMRLHRKGGPTLIDLAEEMLAETAGWFAHRPIRVAADGFYAPLAGRSLGPVTLISRLKRNATLYDLPPKRKEKRRGRPRTKGKKLAKPEKMAAHVRNWQLLEFRQRGRTVKRLVYSRLVLWYAVSKTPILLVICRDPEGKEKDDFLVTTDTGMSAAEVLECFGDRWAIEETFKHAKQYLGVQQPQTWKRQGPERAAALGLWLYSMVWLWYLRQKGRRRWFRIQPWHGQKITPSFADALACLRHELWQQQIKSMFGNSFVHDKKLKYLLETLACAA